MTHTPKKQDLSALFPAPRQPDLPPHLEVAHHALARGLEIRNLPDCITPESLITNFCAAFAEVTPYSVPFGYRQVIAGTNPPAIGAKITFEEHVHYPALMSVFAEVLEGEFLRANMDLTLERMPAVTPVDLIADPSNPPRFTSGPRFGRPY
jgi:hypothetical protein